MFLIEGACPTNSGDTDVDVNNENGLDKLYSTSDSDFDNTLCAPENIPVIICYKII